MTKDDRPKNCSIEDPLPIRIVLDYYLKEMRSCQELATEVPRPAEIFSFKKPVDYSDASDNDDAANAGLTIKKQERKLRTKKETVAIRLNNNLLTTVCDLPAQIIANKLIPKPEKNLMWIDLSFNLLTTIDKELLDFKKLRILYMHGNRIEKLSEVEKLCVLPDLEKLTTNGNPELEKIPHYRKFTIGAVPQMRSLDHTVVTRGELAASRAFYVNYVTLRKMAREKAREKRELADAAAF